MSEFDEEFRGRFAGRYFGKYRAVVTDVADPLKLNRLMVIAPVVLGEEPIGWAFPSAMAAGEGAGFMWSPTKNDYVWVEFEEGDPQKAIWSPGPWARRDGANMAPNHAQGEFGDEDVLLRDQGVLPPSLFAGTYSNVRGMRSPGGSGFEMDDTPGQERAQVFHPSGSRWEAQSDGSVHEVSAAGARHRVGGNRVVEVVGDEMHTIGGNRTLQIAGTSLETITGDITRALKNVTETGEGLSQTWGGALSQTVGGTWNMQVASQGALQFGGGLGFMVGQGMTATVLETLEFAASNSTGLPTSTALLLHAYNGKAILKSTDLTGLAEEASVTLDGTPAIGGLELRGGKLGGAIKLTGLPVGNVLLTGVGAAEPYVLGNQLVALLTTLLTDLATHTHLSAAPGSPTSPPATAAVYASSIAQLATLLSLKILGS